MEKKNVKKIEILKSVLSFLCELVNFNQATVYVNKNNKLLLFFSYPHNKINLAKSIELPEMIENHFKIKDEPYLIKGDGDLGFLFESPGKQGDFTCLFIPLKVESEFVGMLVLHQKSPEQFDKKDFPLMMLYSEQIAIIARNIELFTMEQKKSMLLSQINIICHNIDSIMNINELYKRVVNVIQQDFGYDSVALYVVDDHRKKINLKAISGIYSNITPRNQELSFGQGIVGWVVQTGKTVLSNDTAMDPHFYNITPKQTPTKSELCVPIKMDNKITGVLNIESREIMDFDENDLNSLEVLANRIGVSIHNSKLFQEAQDNSQRLYDILSSMGQGIITIGKDFKIKWMNKTLKDWGWKSADVLDKYCYDLFNHNPAHCSNCPGKRTFLTGKIARKMIYAKNGKYYLITSAPLQDNSGNINQILEVIEDITKAIKIEREFERNKKQLEHSKYLAAVGELAASIAHEVRNPLNALSNAIDILQTDLDVTGDYKKLMQVAYEESKRINIIISHYLKFARPPELELGFGNIKKTIEETITLLKLEKNNVKNIEIETFFEDNLPDIYYDPNLIKQVLWNLFMNSMEAISADGIIGIEVRTSDEHVLVLIRDNGTGIATTELEKIFEPFYSVKAEGTGLGLSIVKSIIEQHNWTIEVQSEPGKGTIFTIFIPLK